MYAGFPSGQKLSEILLENLTESEKENININQPLPELAEDFYRLKGNNRNSLIKIIKKAFSEIKPLSTHIHDSLGIIPHFKTIITTNYDCLIEDAFQDKGEVIIISKSIPYLEKDKVQIFKVHGDFSLPDSIIITKSDYNNFFTNNTENDIYWTVIKERLSTNNVLFLGYNLEDPNVSVIFDRISTALGPNRKECFLVAPNLPKHKQTDLMKKGIHYIDTTAEQLITELIENLKENIIGDLEKGDTSADTFRNFLANIKLLPELKAEEKNFKLRSLYSTGETLEGKINFTVKNDPDFIKELNEFISGKGIGSFKISDDKLIDADLWYGGLKYPKFNGGQLVIKSVPKIDTIVDVRFDDGTEFTEIPIKIYGANPIIEIHIELNNAIFNLHVDITSYPKTAVKFDYTHKDTCRSVREEIDLFTLMTYISKGLTFTTFTKKGETYTNSFPILQTLLEDSQYYLDYFKSLKKIENYYRVRFSDIEMDTITKSMHDKIKVLLSAIEGEFLEYYWDAELTFEIEDEIDQTINQLKAINNENGSFVGKLRTNKVIEVHGQEFDLGFERIEILNAHIVNLTALIDKKENLVKMRSKTKKALVSYSKSI